MPLPQSAIPRSIFPAAGERDDEIGIIVRESQVMRAEVHDLMSRSTQ